MAIRTRTILPLVAQVAHELDGDVSLAAMANRARRSPFEVHRAFRRVTGETPKAYTQRLRLDRAAAQLVSDERAILDIALDNGFASHEVFTRAFSRRFHMSPSAYRARGLNGTATQRAHHADVVFNAGPCVGLYRLASAERNAMSTSPSITRRMLEPRHAFVIRRSIAPSEIAATLAELFPKVVTHVMSNGGALAGPPFARYAEVGMGHITIEAGFTIAAPIAARDNIEAVELPGCSAAIAIHRGPYDQLPETHNAIVKWIEANALSRGGAPWEVYVTDPGTTPNPADWETEVIYPLRA